MLYHYLSIFSSFSSAMSKVEDSSTYNMAGSSSANLTAEYGKHEFELNMPQDMFNFTDQVEVRYDIIIVYYSIIYNTALTDIAILF